MSEVTAVRNQLEASPTHSPVLLRELEPWRRVFADNLADLVLRRQLPPLDTTTRPVPLRRDYFIKTGIDASRFVESYGGHIAFVALVYLICTLPLFNREPKLRSPFENTTIAYQPLSDYLPPMNTTAKMQTKSRKGAPKLAKQEILSIPANPDNSSQTIVTPPKIKLNTEVKLPNIVAWTPIPAAQPVAASARPVSQLRVPQFDPEVVAPTADVSQMKDNLKLHTLAAPAAVAPTVSTSQLKLPPGQLDMADLQPQVAAPKLPVAPQHAADAADGKGTGVPPSPNLGSLGAAQGQGQIIALGLDPADVRGPISVPAGNRSGEFHASPAGKPDAPGTPNVTGAGTAAEGGGHGRDSGAPPGIMVGAPPAGAVTSAMAGTPSPTPKPPPAGSPDAVARQRIFAAAMKPSLPTYRNTRPSAELSNDPGRNIEQKVFGPKRYYSLIMNMPNLTSATGSWIIRFAELKQTDDAAPLTAPVATTKVDPAYPADALRDHVEGIVTLYAIIRADGTVADIRVLDGLDSRLDQNAIRALSGWRFRPGTKNGEAVAVEAVVEIPFRMRAIR